MLLTCPECKTVFRVEKSAINIGRKVNCGVCKIVYLLLVEYYVMLCLYDEVCVCLNCW